jgi:1-acyl-sn-glycerol-3-phosphate acyltransferase
MSALWITLCSIWTWIVLVTLCLVWLPLMAIVRLVTWPFDPGRYHTGLLFRKIGVYMARANPLWDFRSTGTLITDPRRPYIVVSNHESFADIMLVSHLPWDMKWLGKVELFRIPIMGWLLSLAGDIPVLRGDRRSAIEAMRSCRDMLVNKHMSVMIFPEGTRSTTAELLPFKDGAFRLAIDTQVRILPLALYGTRTALPKHGWRFGRATAVVKVLDPIDVTGLTAADAPALRDRVRNLIDVERTKLREELGGAATAQGSTT